MAPSRRICLVFAAALSLPHQASAVEWPSEMSEQVRRSVRNIVAHSGARAERTLSRIGDSQTVQSGFLQCFADANGEFGALTDTARYFRGSDHGYKSYLRKSLAAKDGQMVQWARRGPLQEELLATRARYAIVLFGTNDVQNAPTGGLDQYERELSQLADSLIKQGTIPLLSTPPPRPFRALDVAHFGPEGATPWIPRYAEAVRRVAVARSLPVVDLEAALRNVPGQGIRSDGVHLSVAGKGPCDFSELGLSGGHNMRNWLTMRTLAEVRSALQSTP